MAIIAGPAQIALSDANEIARELERRGDGLVRSVQPQVHHDGKELVLFVVIPDVDPFERSRLDRIFDLAEEIIVARIPHAIPIRDDAESWSVTVVNEEDWGKRFATIDAMYGGRMKPSRTTRLSDPP